MAGNAMPYAKRLCNLLIASELQAQRRIILIMSTLLSALISWHHGMYYGSACACACRQCARLHEAGPRALPPVPPLRLYISVHLHEESTCEYSLFEERRSRNERCE